MKFLKAAVGATLWLAAALTTGCGHSGQRTADHPTDYITVYKPDYASHFTIDSVAGKQSLVITVREPWQGADGVVSRLFVARNGEEAPDGFQGQVLPAPPRRIVAMSSTHVAMLEALGSDSLLSGAAGVGYISSEKVRRRAGEIADVGYEGNVNYETLVGVGPDLVLLYGINGASSLVPKLEELGVPYLYVGDYLEESPLGKAEWMVAVAEALGGRRKGIDAFSPIPEAYLSMKEKAAAVGMRPRVMLNSPYADSWMLPPEGSYAVRLIEDAGGTYAGPRREGNASGAIGMEEALSLMMKADVWLNVGPAASMAELLRTAPLMQGTPPVKQGKVFNNTLRATPGGGNDYYESGVTRPDLVLRDIIKILHPDLVADPFVYYLPLR